MHFKTEYLTVEQEEEEGHAEADEPDGEDTLEDIASLLVGYFKVRECLYDLTNHVSLHSFLCNNRDRN